MTAHNQLSRLFVISSLTVEDSLWEYVAGVINSEKLISQICKYKTLDQIEVLGEKIISKIKGVGLTRDDFACDEGAEEAIKSLAIELIELINSMY